VFSTGQDKWKDQTKSCSVKDMKAGSVHTLIMSGVNPVLLLESASFWRVKITTSVSLSKEHETALLSTIAAPVPHYLEWMI
jgi:molybdopterin-containing oxidoreductase family iron-sulfur binding subunit